MLDKAKYFDYVDRSQDDFVEHLRRWVAIKSISGEVEQRKECFRMVDQVASEMRELGFNVDVRQNPVGSQTMFDGEVVALPPIILAERHVSNSYKTLAIYGHLDVQPAQKSDGWKFEPFVLTEDEGRMYGRGSTDDKGPVLGWLCMLKSMKATGQELKINLKFCLEAMEEAGSVGLDELVEIEKDKFFKDVDFVCISDNYWLGGKKPCLTYGLRGIVYFQVKISGPNQDLHSGIYGGSVDEPLEDLFHVMSKLIKPNGEIMVPHLMDDVDKLEASEKQTYTDVDFDLTEFKEHIGVQGLRCKTKEEILMNRWRYPSLSIHGVEGAFDGHGEKTVIPRTVIGKFSIRMVPSMDVEKTTKLVTDYLVNVHKSLGTSTKLDVLMGHGCPGWVTDFNNDNYRAAARAMEEVYKVKPDLTREGGSIPVAMTFENLLHKSVLLLPMGKNDDGAHSQNEKLDRDNFVKGIKLFGVYVDEMSKL